MKTSPVADVPEKKGHICPPSNATHPRDRWESLFVYSFICKFTQLRGKVEGLETPMDFEAALLSPEATTIMTQILSRFILNLRPQTRNLSPDVIPLTLATLLQEYFKSSERTVFWSDEYKANIDPLQSLDGGFWNADWDLRLKLLRQLVELQLCHSTEIKSLIDRAWGVVHNKHKKAETASAPPPSSDPFSLENLQLQPLGQDVQRKRYWVIDNSPRVYLSTNPWKITATFQAHSSTREEYLFMIQKLKESAPPDAKDGERRTKLEQGHLSLIKALEDRIPGIDAELTRIQRIRRKIEQRQILMAQAEVRETRTRRRTTRPDYAYLNDPDELDDDDGDGDYQFNQADQDGDDQLDDDYLNAHPPVGGKRRSGRKASGNDDWSEWRGERRSTRLGIPAEPQPDVPPPKKRARTVESTSSNDTPSDRPPPGGGSGLKIRIRGAAAPKPTETLVESVAGKKKSKFWVYAVEPIGPPSTHPPTNGTPNNPADLPLLNGYTNGHEPTTDGEDPPASLPPSDSPMNEDEYDRSIGGSLSPASSMDES